MHEPYRLDYGCGPRTEARGLEPPHPGKRDLLDCVCVCVHSQSLNCETRPSLLSRFLANFGRVLPDFPQILPILADPSEFSPIFRPFLADLSQGNDGIL